MQSFNAGLASRRERGARWSCRSIKKASDGASEVAAVVTVDERVDAAVGGTQPLGHGRQVLLDRHLLFASHRSPEEVAQSDRVQREPGQRKQDDDDDQHLQDLRLRPENAALRPRPEKTAHPPTPDAYADQHAEDDDQRQRDEVAGEEDGGDGERPPRRRVAPVGVAGDVVVVLDAVGLLLVDENPRNENGGRKEPYDCDYYRSYCG